MFVISSFISPVVLSLPTILSLVKISFRLKLGSSHQGTGRSRCSRILYSWRILSIKSLGSGISAKTNYHVMNITPFSRKSVKDVVISFRSDMKIRTQKVGRAHGNILKLFIGLSFAYSLTSIFHCGFASLTVRPYGRMKIYLKNSDISALFPYWLGYFFNLLRYTASYSL